MSVKHDKEYLLKVLSSAETSLQDRTEKLQDRLYRSKKIIEHLEKAISRESNIDKKISLEADLMLETNALSETMHRLNEACRSYNTFRVTVATCRKKLSS